MVLPLQEVAIRRKNGVFCDFRDINRKATHLGSLFFVLGDLWFKRWFKQMRLIVVKIVGYKNKKRDYISVISSLSVTPTGFKPVTA